MTTTPHVTADGHAAEPDGPMYEPVPLWPRIPHGITFRGSATSVAVDSQDHVHVFNRGNRPLLVFNRDGDLLDMWEDEGHFVRAHAITIDAEDNLFLVDDGGHFIEKRSPEGKVLLRLGRYRDPAPRHSGEVFNRPTDISVHPGTGELFVSDGYGNSRVHRFSPDGEHMISWGEPGADPGQFSLPHNILVTDDDRVMVCDRENFRIQVFTLNGEFIEQWHLHRPVCIAASEIDGASHLLIGEHSPPRIQRGVPNLGTCVKVLDTKGSEITRMGGELPGHAPEQFMDPHGLATDSEGDVYVAEVCNSWLQSLDGPPPLGEWPSLRKWRRSSATGRGGSGEGTAT